MELIWNHGPLLSAMILLIFASGLFSAAEAAFFSLSLEQRKNFLQGTGSQKLAAGLLNIPEELLSAVLFWNLVINVLYFSLASILGIRLEEQLGTAASTLFATGALLTIIFCSEMLPKSLAVLRAGGVAAWLAYPIAISVRLVSPILPILRWINEISRRIIWPQLEPEPYLQISDLNRAITLSNQAKALNAEEEAVLQGIVLLSDITVDELMRPRLQYKTFKSPVQLENLEGQIPPSGYVLITDEENEEVIAAINLRTVIDIPNENIEQVAQKVLWVPWCMTAAVALQKMWLKQIEVATVVNEFGEMIGILTLADLTQSIFSQDEGRSERLLNRATFEEVEPGKWVLTGITSLRRLAKQFEVELPDSRYTTLNGVLQESLEQLPVVDDEIDWGPFHFKILEADDRGQTMVCLTLLQQGEQQP